VGLLAIILAKFSKAVLAADMSGMVHDSLSGETYDERDPQGVFLQAFKAIDTDGNGGITQDECRGHLLTLMRDGEETLSAVEVEKIMQEGDSNANGEIDYKEFVQMMTFTPIWGEEQPEGPNETLRAMVDNNRSIASLPQLVADDGPGDVLTSAVVDGTSGPRRSARALSGGGLSTMANVAVASRKFKRALPGGASGAERADLHDFANFLSQVSTGGGIEKDINRATEARNAALKNKKPPPKKKKPAPIVKDEKAIEKDKMNKQKHKKEQREKAQQEKKAAREKQRKADQDQRLKDREKKKADTLERRKQQIEQRKQDSVKKKEEEAQAKKAEKEKQAVENQLRKEERAKARKLEKAKEKRQRELGIGKKAKPKKRPREKVVVEKKVRPAKKRKRTQVGDALAARDVPSLPAGWSSCVIGYGQGASRREERFCLHIGETVDEREACIRHSLGIADSTADAQPWALKPRPNGKEGPPISGALVKLSDPHIASGEYDILVLGAPTVASPTAAATAPEPSAPDADVSGAPKSDRTGVPSAPPSALAVVKAEAAARQSVATVPHQPPPGSIAGPSCRLE
jgi:chemotaxis protein histidine kinase CheA